MDVNELSTNELNELREIYYDQLLTSDEDVLGDITSASEIPLSNVKQHYEGIYFVKDDFFCNLDCIIDENIEYKRIIQSSSDIYSFENTEDGMLIKKNDVELGVYTGFELGDNLEGDYLIELAQEFGQ